MMTINPALLLVAAGIAMITLVCVLLLYYLLHPTLMTLSLSLSLYRSRTVRCSLAPILVRRKTRVTCGDQSKANNSSSTAAPAATTSAANVFLAKEDVSAAALKPIRISLDRKDIFVAVVVVVVVVA